VSGPTDRQEKLLVDRALDGLPEEEARELERLGAGGEESFDYAAAAAALAALDRAEDAEKLPEALAARVLADAAGRTAAAGPARASALPVTVARRPRWDRGRAVGWIAAAAAAVLAVLGWTRPPRIVERVQVVEVRPPPPRELTPAERRAALLSEAPDVRTAAWAAAPDPAAKGATGDVVWSPSRQIGYLRIRGLAANDPRVLQYQLWIIDGKRDPAQPVDGGVFDVVEGEVVIPIRAAIRVFEPKLFAVTVERPGGVVVSKRERMVLTAAL